MTLTQLETADRLYEIHMSSAKSLAFRLVICLSDDSPLYARMVRSARGNYAEAMRYKKKRDRICNHLFNGVSWETLKNLYPSRIEDRRQLEAIRQALR